MLRPFLLIACLLLSSSAFAQKFDWVKSIDGFTCYSSAVDREQNVVCVGGFEGITTVGDKQYVASGAADLMVVKYDRLGNVLWSFVGGGTARRYN